MMPMREDQDIFLAHPTVETAWLVDGVCWSCHKKPAKLSCPVHLLHAENFLGHNFAAPLFGVCLISACVRCLDSLWALWWPLLKFIQHFIQFCQHKDVHFIPNTKSLERNRGEDYWLFIHGDNNCASSSSQTERHMDTIW